MNRIRAMFATVALATPLPTIAQTPDSAIAVRPLGPTVAVSPVSFRNVSGVLELSDGRVMVNDGTARAVVMLDSNLANPRLVMDSVAGRPNSYGPNTGALIRYLGDTVIYIDQRSATFIVIDPHGEIVRVVASPTPGSVTAFFGGKVGVQPPGKVVYRVPARSVAAGGRAGAAAGGAQPPVPERPAPPDFAWIVTTDLQARTTDTVGSIAISPLTIASVSPQGNLFPQIDDWVVLRDGTVALIRGREYRIEWISPNGTTATSPRIPYEWKRLSDDEKQQVADSLTRARDSTVARLPAGARPMFDALGRMSGYSIPSATATNPSPPSAPIQMPPPISAAFLPDYMPVFTVANAMADGEDRIWIMVRGGTPAFGAVYDVIDRYGERAGRVQLPPGQVLVGFGAGDAVYLQSRDAGMSRLAKVRFR